MKTSENVRDEFLASLRQIAHYWAKLPDINKMSGEPLTILQRCEGAIFSALCLLDGVADGPPFDLVTLVYPEDEDGEPDDTLPGTEIVISEMLHERFFLKDKQ